MINLRYHIVSITAVFLALGIGLAFGASFIDQGTIGALEQNLNEIEGQNDRLELENQDLEDRLDTAATIDEGLRLQGLPELLAGRLSATPVLLLAADGADAEIVDRVEATLVAAGAELAGILRVTDRFALDDGSELGDLRAVLGLPDAPPEQLRVAVTRQVASLLREAATPVADAGGGGDPGGGAPTPLPPLLERLLGAGFLEFDAADQPTTEFVLVPATGLRVVAVGGAGSAGTDADFLVPTLQRLVAPALTAPDAPPPVVVAVVPSPAADTPDPGAFVATFRDDDAVRTRIATVDEVDTFAGLLATVLAVEHGASGQTGHYGVGDGAQALLPAPLVVEGGG